MWSSVCRPIRGVVDPHSSLFTYPCDFKSVEEKMILKQSSIEKKSVGALVCILAPRVDALLPKAFHFQVCKPVLAHYRRITGLLQR